METQTAGIVEVYIPTWQSEPTLHQCLQHARQEFGEQTKFIVIDKFSEDKTCSIAKSFNCTIIKHKGNLGIVRTLALHWCKTPYLFFLDSDCYLKRGYFQKSLNFLETHPKCGAVHGTGILTHPTYRRYSEFVKRKYMWLKDKTLETACIKPVRGFTGATLIRTEVAKGFKTNAAVYHDWLLQRYIESKGYSWLQLNNLEFIHDQGNIFNTAKWMGSGTRITKVKPFWKMFLAPLFMPLTRTPLTDVDMKILSFRLSWNSLIGFIQYRKYEEKFGK